LPGESYGKSPSLIAMLPAAAGVRRARITEPDRYEQVITEAYRPLRDDGGAGTS
jgi:hypothetical protein